MVKQGTFSFDLHNHGAEGKLEDVLYHASRNLDLLGMVGREDCSVYDELERIANDDGKISDNLRCETLENDKRVLKVIYEDAKEYNELYVARCQEVMDKNGKHYVAAFIDTAIDFDLSSDEIIDNIIKQDGMLIVPHPMGDLYRGCGKEKVEEIVDKYLGELPIALEINGQIPDRWEANRLLEKLAKKLGVPVVASSDIHARYLEERKRFGEILHSVSKTRPEEHESIEKYIKDLVMDHPEDITFEGHTISLWDLFMWQVHSTCVRGPIKPLELAYQAYLEIKGKIWG